MKNFIRMTCLLMALMFINLATVEAQKIGTLNTQGILIEMAEVKAMDAELKSLMTQLQKQGQKKVEDYKAKEAKAVQSKERGELSPKAEEALLVELQAEQEKIMTLEKEMEQKVVAKREALLKPIYDKINVAIQAVAKEKGFLYIMDASVVSYTDEANDVTNLVKAKLGM